MDCPAWSGIDPDFAAPHRRPTILQRLMENADDFGAGSKSGSGASGHSTSAIRSQALRQRRTP
jgi:hypothetical protein